MLEKKSNVFDSLSEGEGVEDDETINLPFYIINRSGWFYFSWQLVMIVCIGYSISIETYRFAFYEDDTTIWLLLSLVIDFIFLVDLALNFFLPFNIGEKVIYNHKAISKNYLTTYFVIDFLSSIPTSLIRIGIESDRELGKVVRIGRLYRIGKMLKIIRFLKINSFKHTNSIEEGIIEKITSSRLFSILFYFLITIHIAACILIFLGFYLIEEGETWITTFKFNDADEFTIYIAAVYFSCTTVLGIGYGDIVTIHIIEKLFNVIFNIVGVFLFTYILSAFSSIFYKIDVRAVILRKNLEIFDRLCGDYVIEDNLKQRVKETLRHHYSKSQMEKYNLIESLPFTIKNKLVYIMHKKYINSLDFLAEKSKEFLFVVLPLFRNVLFLKKEYLIKMGQFFEEIYIVTSGFLSLELGSSYDSVEVARIKKYQHFGDVLMFIEEQSPFGIKVKSSKSNILTLSKVNFEFLKANFHSDLMAILREQVDRMEVIETRRRVVMEIYKHAANSEELHKAINLMSLFLFEKTEGELDIDDLVKDSRNRIFFDIVNQLKTSGNKFSNVFLEYLKEQKENKPTIKKKTTKKELKPIYKMAKEILEFSRKSSKINAGLLKESQTNENDEEGWEEKKIDLNGIKKLIECEDAGQKTAVNKILQKQLNILSPRRKKNTKKTRKTKTFDDKEITFVDQKFNLKNNDDDLSIEDPNYIETKHKAKTNVKKALENKDFISDTSFVGLNVQEPDDIDKLGKRLDKIEQILAGLVKTKKNKV